MNFESTQPAFVGSAPISKGSSVSTSQISCSKVAIAKPAAHSSTVCMSTGSTQEPSRRAFLFTLTGFALATVSASTLTSSALAVGARTKEAYLAQIQAGYDTLKDLDAHWEEKTDNFDGDVVRRILGTVGTTSPLFSIKKAFEAVWKSKSVDPEADIDVLDEVSEKYNKILDGISAIDFQLYSVNFTELTPTKQKLIKDGKLSLDKVLVLYGEVLDLIKDF